MESNSSTSQISTNTPLSLDKSASSNESVLQKMGSFFCVSFIGAVTGILGVVFSMAYAVAVFHDGSEILGYGFFFFTFGIAISAICMATLGTIKSLAVGIKGSAVPILASIYYQTTQSLQGATPEQIFLNFLFTIMISGVITGTCFFILGHFKVGNIVRFLPYPVICGFLAGSSILLIKSGIMITWDPTLAHSSSLSESLWDSNLSIVKLVYSLSIGLLLLLCTFYRKQGILLVGIVLAGFGTFYFFKSILGFGVEDAVQSAWLFDPAIFNNVDFSAVLNMLGNLSLSDIKAAVLLVHGGNLVALALINIFSALFAITALELIVEREIDLNHEFKSLGVSNIVSGLCGGANTSHLIADTTLLRTLGPPTRLATYVMGIVMLLFLFLGTQMLQYVPVSLMSGIILFIGFSFVSSWIIVPFKRMSRLEYSLLILICLIIAFSDFTNGIFLGLFMSVVLFLIKYSKVSFITRLVDGATLQSNVDRRREDKLYLKANADKYCICGLKGYIFFGTANNLFHRVSAAIRESPAMKYFIFDCTKIEGFDSSAYHSFSKIRQQMDDKGITMVFSGLSQAELRNFQELQLIRSGESHYTEFSDSDHALEWVENQILLDAPKQTQSTEKKGDSLLYRTIKEFIQANFAEPPEEYVITGLVDYFQLSRLKKGEYLLRQGSEASGIYFIESGQLTVRLELPNDQSLRLRKMMPGNIVGELSFYLNKNISASVIAEEATNVYLFPLDSLKEMERVSPQAAAVLHKYLACVLSERLVDTNNFLQQGFNEG